MGLSYTLALLSISPTSGNSLPGKILLQPGVSAKTSSAPFASSFLFPTKAINGRIQPRAPCVFRRYETTSSPTRPMKSPCACCALRSPQSSGDGRDSPWQEVIHKFRTTPGERPQPRGFHPYREAPASCGLRTTWMAGTRPGHDGKRGSWKVPPAYLSAHAAFTPARRTASWSP
jgi:hypothetical protein